MPEGLTVCRIYLAYVLYSETKTSLTGQLPFLWLLICYLDNRWVMRISRANTCKWVFIFEKCVCVCYLPTPPSFLNYMGYWLACLPVPLKILPQSKDMNVRPKSVVTGGCKYIYPRRGKFGCKVEHFAKPRRLEKHCRSVLFYTWNTDIGLLGVQSVPCLLPNVS